VVAVVVTMMLQRSSSWVIRSLMSHHRDMTMAGTPRELEWMKLLVLVIIIVGEGTTITITVIVVVREVPVETEEEIEVVITPTIENNRGWMILFTWV